MSDDPTSKAPNDLLVPLTPANEAGEQVAVRRDSEGNVTLGTIGPIKDGSPIPEDAEVLGIQHYDGPVYEITGSTKTGPAKVNSQAYKSGWDNIFGKPKAPTDSRPN